MLPSARLFRSRWAALLWAGGIVWFAVDFAQSQVTEAAPTNAAASDRSSMNEAELESLSNALTL
ncbi:hypothetical protein [Sphingomonas sp.]|uniref:hypothetical protein n=1 Tax=Sphingomonas sp. TaxID=28214 RepID=UPI0035BC68A8